MINSMANTFSGGIKLNDGKELSKDAPITTILPGPEMVYPLLQHIGNPSVPVVREGDHGICPPIFMPPSRGKCSELKTG